MDINKRLNKEIIAIKEDKNNNIDIYVKSKDMTEMLFKLENLNPPYSGEYYGIMKLKDYPYLAPVISFITPNGRFKPNTPICLAGLTHYHDNEWSPATKLSAILISLIYAMVTNEFTNGVGSIVTTFEERKSLAEKSKEFNLNNKIIISYLNSDD